MYGVDKYTEPHNNMNWWGSCIPPPSRKTKPHGPHTSATTHVFHTMDHHMFPGIGTCQVQCRCHHFDIPESKLLQVNKLMYGLAQIARVVSYIIIHTFIAEFS